MLDNAWIQLIAGAALGWQLPNIWRLLTHWVYFSRRPHQLDGVWHTYHWTRLEGHPLLRYEKWHIRRRQLGGIKVSTEDAERPTLTYTGTAELERGHVLLCLKSQYGEQFQVRLNDPIPGSSMIGLLLGVDFSGHTYTTAVLATRRKLSKEHAVATLSGRAESVPDELALRLRERKLPETVAAAAATLSG